MNTSSVRLLSLFLIAGLLPIAVGCEGVMRHHDERAADINLPPEDDYESRPMEFTPPARFADMVEELMQSRERFLAARQDYVGQLIALEGSYLRNGDTTRANWARYQREAVEKMKIEEYPYLTEGPAEMSVEVAPLESIPQADALYAEGSKKVEDLKKIPFLGLLEHHKKDMREALAMLKRVISEYPTSDKVDDAAYYIGEIYKEYLRDEDPNNELAIRYYKWAYTLDPETPHPARFWAAVVHDFRRHDRAKALELYHEVLEREEAGNNSNQRFAATRIEQLTDDDGSHLRPKEPNTATVGRFDSSDDFNAPSSTTP